MREDLEESRTKSQLIYPFQVSLRIWHLWAEAVQAKLSAPLADLFWPCDKAETVFGAPLSLAELP